MQNRILLLVFALFLGNSFGETYISVDGPVTSTRCSYSKMGRSPNYIRWENSEITWRINENGCSQSDNIALESLINAVQNGFDAWDEVITARFNFYYGGRTDIQYGNDGKNVVYWAENNDPAFEEGGPLEGFYNGTLAITVITINDNEEILDADIIFNGRDHTWKTNDEAPDIWAVATHEVGHLLGLFHSDHWDVPVAELPSMIYYYNSLAMRDITFDDEKGVSFLYGGNLLDDEVFNGNIFLKWNINVLMGKTLFIQPGSVIKLFREASIRVAGELNAIASLSQKISFRGYGSSTWSGIYFLPQSRGSLVCCYVNGVQSYGGGALTINNSSPRIQNCTIENNTGYCHGICLINNAAPEIFGNTVRSNSAHGIYIYDSNPCIVNNSITGSFNKGIAAVYCDYHSAPVFGTTSPPSEGNNILTGSYYGLYAANNSIPCAGQLNFANHNYIHGNYYADVAATNNSTIYAINNSWDQDFRIIVDNSSHVYFKPYLNLNTIKYDKLYTNSVGESSLQEKNVLMKQFFLKFAQFDRSAMEPLAAEMNKKFPGEPDVLLASWLLYSERPETIQGIPEVEEALVSEDIKSVNISPDYILYQNYPNPFNASTTIKYFSGRQQHVTLVIYDMLGNLIETAINNHMPAGNYEVSWNAEGLPSGIYIYQLQIGSTIEAKKMILMK